MKTSFPGHLFLLTNKEVGSKFYFPNNHTHSSTFQAQVSTVEGSDIACIAHSTLHIALHASSHSANATDFVMQYYCDIIVASTRPLYLHTISLE